MGVRESPLENVDVSDIPPPFAGSFAGKRVVVTGHTGFKGSWLCEWLLSLGAEVTGLALEPDTTPSLFDKLGLRDRLNDVVGDIRSQETVSRVLAAAKPDFLFHMAAQPLVRRSYREPVETWNTNVLGTIHVMEALRRLDESCAGVCVTTDKCYENREWLRGCRESDPYAVHEATLLNLDNAKAEALLGWRPTWAFDRTIDVTVAWYRDLRDAASPSAVAAKTPQDIRRHEADARGRGVGWAVIPPSLRPGSEHV